MSFRSLSLLLTIASTSLTIPTLTTSEARAQTTDSEFWSSASGELKLAKRSRGSLTQGLRFDNDLSDFKHAHTQLEFDYRLKTLVGFATGYRYVVRSTRGQHRVHFDLVLRHRIKPAKLKLQYRVRIQQTILLGNMDRTNFRNRVQLSRVFKWGDPYAALELSYRIDKSQFRQYRITGGIKWRLAKRSSLSTFYALARQFNRRINNADHIFGVSLTHRFQLAPRRSESDGFIVSERPEPVATVVPATTAAGPGHLCAHDECRIASESKPLRRGPGAQVASMMRAHSFLQVLCLALVIGCTQTSAKETTPAIQDSSAVARDIIDSQPASKPTDRVLEGWTQVDDMRTLVHHVDQTAEKGTPILVHITATWCTDCLALERNVLGNEKVAIELTDVHRILIDVTSISDESQQLLAIFGVKGLPAILYYDDVVPLAGFLMAPQKTPRPEATVTILEPVDVGELLRRLKKSP